MTIHFTIDMRIIVVILHLLAAFFYTGVGHYISERENGPAIMFLIAGAFCHILGCNL